MKAYTDSHIVNLCQTIGRCCDLRIVSRAYSDGYLRPTECYLGKYLFKQSGVHAVKVLAPNCDKCAPEVE